ncbi:MAG TPA: hypothetical protein VGL56_14335 [Fimbriimonadaceae bacterium]
MAAPTGQQIARVLLCFRCAVKKRGTYLIGAPVCTTVLDAFGPALVTRQPEFTSRKPYPDL